MKKRADLIIRFAENGLIVTERHPDYSRDCQATSELVFNKLIDFERWFERHADMNDDGSDLHETTLGDLAEEADYDLEQKVFVRPGLMSRAFMKSGPLVMGADPAGPGFDRIGCVRVSMDAKGAVKYEPIEKEQMFIEPKPVDENVVDALREAENVVKRFTGVGS